MRTLPRPFFIAQSLAVPFSFCVGDRNASLGSENVIPVLAGGHMLNVQAYLKAAYPLTPDPHLSDEDVSALLDKAEKRRRAAKKASETRKRKRETQA